MAHTFTETVGIVQEVIAYMTDEKNQAALTAKEFNVAPHLTRLQGKQTSITQLNTAQEQLKVSLSKKTAELNTVAEDGYVDASGLIDAMAGVLGKNSKEAENLLKIRSRVRQAKSTPTPQPTPQPVPANA